MHEVELTGLDGSNLLGYLAALGTLRVLSDVDAGVRMSWREKGWWTPAIVSRAETPEALVEVLVPRVCGMDTLDAACRIGKDLTLSRREYAEILNTAARESRPVARRTADFLCAFGSDAFGTGKDQQMRDTEFRTMSGAGHQHFLGFMQELAETTTAEHLRRALFTEWDYADGRPSMRWDPADYRPHALRAEDPSGDPIRTMRGANRLAAEALPLFPTAPGARELFTSGFAEIDGFTQLTWPIWLETLDVDTVASLLALDELHDGRRRGAPTEGDRAGISSGAVHGGEVSQFLTGPRFVLGECRCEARIWFVTTSAMTSGCGRCFRRCGTGATICSIPSSNAT